MGKKHTFEYIKSKVESFGFILKQDFFVNVDTKMKCMCDNNHIFYISFSNLKKGVGCRYCRYTFDIEDLKAVYKKLGCILISTDRNKASTSLEYICPNGHKHSKTFTSFLRNQECPKCKNLLKYNLIKKVLKDKGFKLLNEYDENKYLRDKDLLYYECSNGHVHKATFTTIKKKSYVCPYCSGVYFTQKQAKKYFYKNGFLLLDDYIYNKSSKKLKCKCLAKGHVTCKSRNDLQLSYGCKECSLESKRGSNNHNFKGGVSKFNIPLYSTYAHQLELYNDVHEIRKDINGVTISVLGVSCVYCGKIFFPTKTAVSNRLEAIKGNASGDNNFYCSDSCRRSCPVFWRRIYYKGQDKGSLSRVDQSSWARLVKERDNYICQICGAKNDVMYAHHIEPVSLNPIESTDIDNGITLCELCHKNVHKLPGCSLKELAKCRR